VAERCPRARRRLSRRGDGSPTPTGAMAGEHGCAYVQQRLRSHFHHPDFTTALSQMGTVSRRCLRTRRTATTTAATLTVNNPHTATITTQPANQTVTAARRRPSRPRRRARQHPRAMAGEHGWRVTFSNVSGATSTTLSFTTLCSQSGNRYRAVLRTRPGQPPPRRHAEVNAAPPPSAPSRPEHQQQSLH